MRAFLLIIILIISNSCVSYKYGFWGRLPFPKEVLTSEPNSENAILKALTEKKEKLNQESVLITDEMIKKVKYSLPVSMHSFNSLFENIQAQYTVDTLFHQLYQHSGSDSIRQASKNAILQSAVFYKKVFQKNRFIRRTVNRGDMAFGVPSNTLTQTQQFLWSDKSNRKYLVAHENDKKSTHTIAGFIISKNVDKLQRVGYEFVYYASKVFGEFTGQFHGRIDKKTNGMLLRSQLREFDIVLLKSLTHLTERFIPGYFGHAGVCLGNNLMIETPRSGVRICSVEEFAEGEIFLIIRPTNLTETQKKEIRTSLLSQLGKKYDFVFDSQSPDRIVCSDLICLSYDFIDWQSKKIAGHYVTSPDDLVRTLLNRPDFKFELYLNKGTYINEPDTTFIHELLKKK